MSIRQQLKHHTMTLPDGRTLSYAIHGDPRGEPILHCHGLPGSRLQVHPSTEMVSERGGRMITVDRPGVGASTFKEKRRITDWPADAAALADHLGLAQFSLLGVSGGSPYALACAHAMPERIKRVVLVSPMGPMARSECSRHMLLGTRLALGLARHAPWLLLMPFAFIAHRLRANPDWCPKRFVVQLPEADRRICARPEIKQMFASDFAEATCQKSRGIAWETRLLACPWGFEPADISPAVPVRLWHGTADTIVPVAMGRYLAEHLPNCQPSYLPDEGHYLVLDHYGDVLDAVIAGTMPRP